MRFKVEWLDSDEKSVVDLTYITEVVELMEEEGDLVFTKDADGDTVILVYGKYEDSDEKVSYRNFEPPEDLECEVDMEEIG